VIGLLSRHWNKNHLEQAERASFLDTSTCQAQHDQKAAGLHISFANEGCLSRIPEPDFYPSRIPERIQQQQ
jgi:hypothetical protein